MALEVRDESLRWDDALSLWPEPHMLDGLQRVHPVVGLVVVLPRDPGVRELVGQDLDVEAVADLRPVLRDLHQVAGDRFVDVVLEEEDLLDVLRCQARAEARRELRGVGAIVPRVIGRGFVVDDPVRLRRNRVQVLRVGGAVHRGEEAIGQDEPVRVRPVGGDLAPVTRGVAGEVLPVTDDVVAVHPPAVDGVEPGGEPVRDVVRLPVVAGLQEDVVAVAKGRPVGRAGRTWVRPEVLVERAVLLDHEDDVLDRQVRGQ